MVYQKVPRVYWKEEMNSQGKMTDTHLDTMVTLYTTIVMYNAGRPGGPEMFIFLKKQLCIMHFHHTGASWQVCVCLCVCVCVCLCLSVFICVSEFQVPLI